MVKPVGTVFFMVCRNARLLVTHASSYMVIEQLQGDLFVPVDHLFGERIRFSGPRPRCRVITVNGCKHRSLPRQESVEHTRVKEIGEALEALEWHDAGACKSLPDDLRAPGVTGQGVKLLLRKVMPMLATRKAKPLEEQIMHGRTPAFVENNQAPIFRQIPKATFGSPGEDAQIMTPAQAAKDAFHDHHIVSLPSCRKHVVGAYIWHRQTVFLAYIFAKRFQPRNFRLCIACDVD
jgi:hypothetical protein